MEEEEEEVEWNAYRDYDIDSGIQCKEDTYVMYCILFILRC